MLSVSDIEELYGRQERRLRRVVGSSVRAPEETIEDGCQFAWVALLAHFVLPGETGYVTLPTSRVGAPRTLPPATPPTPRAWYDVLWATVRAADDPATH